MYVMSSQKVSLLLPNLNQNWIF